MNTIYRLRPSFDLTIHELKESYLWFSRPTEYKDVEDSNIFSFIEKTESIKSSFERIYKNYKEVANLCKLVGICSFTRTLPILNYWSKFPNGYNGIFIEYNKEVLENYFVKIYGLGDCFKPVEYLSNPTLFCSLDEHNILWEKKEDGEFYKSLRAIENDPKLLDQLFLKMFTRVNDKFSPQNEARIILGGRNIPDMSKNIKGYKVMIPKEAIQNIYFHPQTPKSFIDELNKIKPGLGSIGIQLST